MNFIDYDYYKNTYCGKLDENDFERVLVKAEAFLKCATRGRVKEKDTVVCFALCELCDVFSDEINTKNILYEVSDGYRIAYTREKNEAWEVLKSYLGASGLLYGGM